jgi:hypothetical protein
MMVIRFNPQKQVLINGLIGIVLGAYCLNNEALIDLVDEYMDKYVKLL